MRMDLPSINSVAGEVSMDHRQYVDDKMNTIVEQINDALEEIQAMKLDFMES